MLNSEEINKLRIKYCNARYDLSFDESILKLLNENPVWRTLFTWRDGLGRTGLSLWGLRYFLPKETECTLRKALNTNGFVSLSYCAGTGMPVYSPCIAYDDFNASKERYHYYCRGPRAKGHISTVALYKESEYLCRFGLDAMTKDELWVFNPNPDVNGMLARYHLTSYKYLIDFISAPEWSHEL